MSKFDLLGAELHPIDVVAVAGKQGVSKGWAGGVELSHCQEIVVPWTNLSEEPFISFEYVQNDIQK